MGTRQIGPNGRPRSMITGTFRALATLLLLTGCDDVARGEAGMFDTIRVRVGMGVDEFNAQPALVRNRMRLDRRGISGVAIGEPHILAVEVNGRTIEFESGGDTAFTRVDNTFHKPNWDSDYSRIGSVTFDINRELITLDEVVALARTACASVRAANLTARYPDRFGIISESLGSGVGKLIANEEDLKAAFSDWNIRAKTVELCQSQDDSHIFALSITNYRRAANWFEGEAMKATYGARRPIE